MKNSILIVVAIVILSGGIAYGQKKQERGQNKEIKSYFEKEIAPQLTIQKEKFFKVLSDEEKEMLAAVEEQRSELRKNREVERASKEGDRKNGDKKQDREQRKEKSKEFHSALEPIIENHPVEVEDYNQFVEKNIPVWEKEIESLHKQNSTQSGKKNQKSGNQFLQRISDPAWLLLWDQDKPSSKRHAHRNNKKHQG